MAALSWTPRWSPGSSHTTLVDATLGMLQHLAEVADIVGQAEPPTFANTVVALERSGRLLGRVSSVFSNLTSSLSTPELRELEATYSARLTAHWDTVRLDPALFARIDAVHEQLDADPDRTDEDRALIERVHLDFVLAGARLDGADRDRLRSLNQALSVLSTTFQQNLLRAMEAGAVLVTDEAELDGASPQTVAAAAAAARERGHAQGWLVSLVLPTGQPLLSVLRDRSLRERLFRASVDRAGPFATVGPAPDGTPIEVADNGPVLLEIVALRAERARLLGFVHHADAVLADRTAGSTEAVDDLLGRLVGPAVRNAEAEAELLREAAARDGVELAPWDWAFYADQVSSDRFQVDTAALRPYFELERVVRDGVFGAAAEVYGITMTLRPDLRGYHPDVRVWEVRDTDGTSIGLFLGDWFARDGKRGGAWMNTFVDQSTLLDELPIVVNVLNLPRPADGGRALLSPDEVRTLFHEFGHALHGLFSRVTYPRLSGTSVPRDVVEFPSQVNEMWIRWPEILRRYARHVDTGERLDQDVVDRLEAASTWGQGAATTEYLAATLLDQAWHRVEPGAVITDVDAFEAQALERAGIVVPLVPPRYRSRYFQHVFSGGYSAGYYSYIWAEVLDADTVQWFRANGGLRRANGDRFRAELLSVGGTVPMGEAFARVTGRDPDIGPLLRRRGLLPTG
ncbi:M3 family metallopeptidase [Nakamurella leprariae]|uniref:M3 family metallopeptidase n=1 Tax=Nakamurella leprariae TaxID=2803911 RepID=A0A938YEX1_9ACTN|nr:M3 family metallopeptidase [Nakamurella leprariae]MBM9469442.1 M3 family metallopeptidase [Nakamurella leprariae]